MKATSDADSLPADQPESVCFSPAAAPHAAFTLVELMVATTIFGLLMGMSLVAYVAVMKRAFHTEGAISGAAELRHATDVISQAVRSAPLALSVDGLKLYVPPKDLGFTVVDEGNTGPWVDMVAGVRGSTSVQRQIKLSDVIPSAVLSSVFVGDSRPSGALGASDIATYFKSGSAGFQSIDLEEVFDVGDTLSIPATAYGAPKNDLVINSISNNAGNKAVTFTTALGVNVPNGTRIPVNHGRRIVFEVTADTHELLYTPDSRHPETVSVLARNIDPRTPPFSLSADRLYLTLNLQQVPKGTTAGRTVQGVRTTVFVRNNPSVQ